MKNDSKTLKSHLACLPVALAIAFFATVHAAEDTNSPISSPVLSPYQKQLATVAKAGEWKGPDKVLPEVSFDSSPLCEVMPKLLEQFDHQFDVLLPNNFEDSPMGPKLGADGKPIPQSPVPTSAWKTVGVNLRLKNVTATELFNAMNMYFEINNQPVRWELLMNGHRPTALLRIGEQAIAQPAAQPQVEPKRAIFYVGELMGDQEAGAMTMKQILKTLTEVSFADYKRAVNVQCHEGAQMLVVKGTPGEIDLVRETIEALKQKAKVDRERKFIDTTRKNQSGAAESKPGPAESKDR
jgi:hypothetical protein